MKIYTDIPYFNFKGNVSYHCKFGSNYFAAVQTGSEFVCQVYSSATEFTIINIQIVARNIMTQEELVITDNSIQFYLYEPISYSKHYPYVTKSTLTSFPITIETNRYPTNDSRVYCRQIAGNGDVEYHKAVEITSNQIQCTVNVSKLTLWNSDEIKIGLWVDATTAHGSSNFYISNNVSHLVFVDPFITTIPSIISTGNLGESFKINASSVSIGHLTTKLIFTPEYVGSSIEFVASCVGFTCNIPQISIPYVPLKVNIKAYFKWSNLPEINITGVSFHYTGN